MSTIEIRASRLANIATELASSPSEVLAVVAYLTADAGETNDDGNLDAMLDVYGAGGDEFATDLAFYLGAKSTNPDAAPFAPKTEFDPAPIDPPAEQSADDKRHADRKAADDLADAIAAEKERTKDEHSRAIKDIVGMITRKYETEGEQNFAIGLRTFTHAKWQRDKFGDKYEAGDVDNLMNRIRDDVRIEVAISPKSIKVGEWMRCAILRELVGEQIGADRAAKMTFFEYRSLYGSALVFDKKNVEGSIKDGWMELVKNVVSARESGQRISSETFLTMVSDTEKRIAASKVTANPEAAKLKEASDKINAKTKAVSKANTDITTSISDAIGAGHITPESVMGILETVTKHHGAEMPKSIGFDPSACSTADCDTLARAMMASGKHAEMVRLRDNLNKCLAVMDKAAEKRLAIAV